MRDIITTIIFIGLLWVVIETNNNITRLDIAEERRIKQNTEIMLLQKDIKRLDERLTRNEIKITRKAEIIVLQKEILEGIEAFERVIRIQQERDKQKKKYKQKGK